jgi:uncharacterized protein (TIGR02453 family)
MRPRRPVLRTIARVWPPAAIEFLRELEENNDRDWFKANRKRYDADLVAPARELAGGVAHLGEPHLFRPYRDTRFRPGPPIKEELGVVIVTAGSAAYYFQLSLDGLLVAGGMHMPATDQLERFRSAIMDDRRAAAFEQAAQGARVAGLRLADPALKRAPRGYPAEHPRLDLLRLKSLTVAKRHELSPWIHSAECDHAVRAELEATAPLIEWLSVNVGPSTRAR